MGWRFRKVFSSGPFRWTWTKKGVGWSIGVPGLRYGVSPNGSRARPSMEACGIDVFKTARDNGFPIEVVRTRDEEENIFGLVLVE